MRITNTIKAGTILAAVLAVAVPQTALANGFLDKLVARKAGTVERLHFKAKKALVTVAQDQAFSHYFHTHSHEDRSQIKPRIDQISLAVQSRFHVEEMCLINPEGAEISRIVGREIADDLATDERSASFFAPGFSQPARKVYISPIYMSPDANKWVIAYVTPIVVDSEKKAILHYEHRLSAFQEKLNTRMENEGGAVLVAIDADGFIVSDSRRPIEIEIQNESEERSDYFAQFDLAGLNLQAVRGAVGGDAVRGSGSVSANGKTFDVSYRAVEDWTILAFRAR